MTANQTPARAPWPAAISIPLRFVYGIYAALLFLAVAITALVGVLLLPTLKARRGTARVAARSFFLLAGMPLRLRGLEHLPAGQSDGLELAAILERADPRDVLVINPVTDASGLADLPAGSRVGTSSPLRRAQLMAARTDLDVADMRGNVTTRLKKMDEGRFHAAVFAAAGLIRLDARQRIGAFLEPPEWLPAAGQGAVVVQIRAADDRMRRLVETLDHAPSRLAVSAERAFLAALEGGPRVPIGALVISSAEERDEHVLHGLISDLGGTHLVRGSRRLDRADPELTGQELAAELRARGGASILAELRAAGQATALSRS